jgi:hypothetical protein|tara:strand:+ start:3101 stop:3610 length:510 start_codon:yes stop_codon:yes gene_type:complete
MEDSRKYQLYINTLPFSGYTQGYGIVQSDKSLAEVPENDFFIQFPMLRTEKIIDYVDVVIDDTIKKIERQEVNPFYMEFGFFENITKIHIKNGDDLTLSVIDYIRSLMPNVSNFSNQEIKRWFDSQGKNRLPWTLIDGSTITLDDLDLKQLNLSNATSKANDLNITINK